MKRKLMAFPVMLLMMCACGGQKQASQHDDAQADTTVVADTVKTDAEDEDFANTPMPKAADELFDDFIFNFCANRKLQMERVAFPLPSVKGDHQTTISKGQWKMEHFFMEQGYYTLLFDNERHMEVVKDTSVRHAIVEKIFFDTGNIQQYVFNRRRGAWMLTTINTIPVNESSNASFLNFFHQFATDKDFQAHSLGESVHFVGPDPDDDFAQMEGEITPDTWEAFAPELPQDMIYNIIYGDPVKEGNSKLFVLRGIANGLELEMTFKRVGGHWQLVRIVT